MSASNSVTDPQLTPGTDVGESIDLRSLLRILFSESIRLPGDFCTRVAGESSSDSSSDSPKFSFLLGTSIDTPASSLDFLRLPTEDDPTDEEVRSRPVRSSSCWHVEHKAEVDPPSVSAIEITTSVGFRLADSEVSALTADRQRGQVEWEWNHMSMQPIWKEWLHLGRRRPFSFSSNSDRHTAHSDISVWVLEEYSNTGSEFRIEASRPRVGEETEAAGLVGST